MALVYRFDLTELPDEVYVVADHDDAEATENAIDIVAAWMREHFADNLPEVIKPYPTTWTAHTPSEQR